VFGKSNKAAPPTPASAAMPAASELAKIMGNGLVQLIVTSTEPIQFYLFLNNLAVEEMDVEEISINIVAADDSTDQKIVRATLSEYVTNVAGQRVLQSRELFPCTFEVIAQDRRIAISCLNLDSTQGLWINVGLKPDGDSHELQGLKEFRFLLTHELLDARITWVDGQSESVYPT